MVMTVGKTPQNTIASLMYTDMNKKGSESLFVRFGADPIRFGLRNLLERYRRNYKALLDSGTEDDDVFDFETQNDLQEQDEQSVESPLTTKTSKKIKSIKKVAEIPPVKIGKTTLEENRTLLEAVMNVQKGCMDTPHKVSKKRKRKDSDTVTRSKKKATKKNNSISVKNHSPITPGIRRIKRKSRQSSLDGSDASPGTPLSATPTNYGLSNFTPPYSDGKSPHSAERVIARQTSNVLTDDQYYILKELRIFNYNHSKAVQCKPTLRLRDEEDVVFMDAESGINVVEQDNKGYGVIFTEHIDTQRTYCYSGWLDSLQKNNAIDETYVLQMDKECEDRQRAYSVLGMDTKSQKPYPSGRVNHSCNPVGTVSYGVVKYEGLHLPVIQTIGPVFPGDHCVTNYGWHFDKTGEFTKCFCHSAFCGGFIEQNLTKAIATLGSNLYFEENAHNPEAFIETFADKPDLLLQHIFRLEQSPQFHSLAFLALHHVMHNKKLTEDQLEFYVHRIMDYTHLNFVRGAYWKHPTGFKRFLEVWHIVHHSSRKQLETSLLLRLKLEDFSFTEMHEFSEQDPLPLVRKLITYFDWVLDSNWEEFRDQCVRFLIFHIQQGCYQTLMDSVVKYDEEWAHWIEEQEQEISLERKQVTTLKLKLT